jgi:hypothetical protein
MDASISLFPRNLGSVHDTPMTTSTRSLSCGRNERADT